MRSEQDSQRLELDRRRYEWEKRHAAEERKRFDIGQEAENLKLKVEEKIVDVEVEERKMEILERSYMVDVFSSVAYKLE